MAVAEATFKKLQLEIIAHGQQQRLVLPISAHVQKYTENFIYIDRIPKESTPISYYECEPLDAWRNIQLIDKTYVIPENSLELYANGYGYTKVASKTFSTPHKEVLITHQSVIDEYGKEKPLWYKHVLPENTVEVNIEIVEGGEKIDIESGLKKDLKHDSLWTNYQNYYNTLTGAYRLYFINSVDSSGKSTTELLNPVPAIGLADWKNINLETGAIEGLSYTFEESSVGYTYYLSGEENPLAAEHCDGGFGTTHDKDLEDGVGAGVFFVKPQETAALKCILPSGKSPKDPWHIKITNGEFFTLLRGKLRKYYVPEYHLQPFSPAKPYIYSPYRKLLWVNRNNLVATRKFLATDPEESRNLTIFVYDSEEILVGVHTTDKALANTRYSDTDIFYEGDTIRSWDNRNGFVSLGIELDPSYNYFASYFYHAKDLEYTSLTLNPLQYKDALVNMWVFYCIPDTHPNDASVHTLGVDRHGIIVYASQIRGRRHPSFQITDKDGNYNPDTVIGMKYSSMVDPNNFKNLYCVPYVNDHCYYILAEALVLDLGDPEDSLVYDVRRSGNTIKEEMFETAIRANHRILQSRLGYGPEGQTVPANNVMVINAPVTLLEEFGGVFTEERAKDLLLTNLPAADTGIVHWEFTSCLLNGISLEKGKVDLTMSWEGPDLRYNIYRRINPVVKWELIATIDKPPEGDIVYRDEDNLESENIYYYAVRIVENGIEMPLGNMLGVMVR